MSHLLESYKEIDDMLGRNSDQLLSRIETIKQGREAAHFLKRVNDPMLSMKTPEEIQADLEAFDKKPKLMVRGGIDCKVTEDEDTLEAWQMIMDGVHRQDVSEYFGTPRWTLMQRFNARGWDTSELPRSAHRKAVK